MQMTLEKMDYNKHTATEEGVQFNRQECGEEAMCSEHEF